MEAGNLHKNTQRPSKEIGGLVLQTGRQAGARRPLGMPTTFVGRGQNCDIRLNVDGVDSLHCLIVCGPDGVLVRDLDSAQGTYVNGTRTEQAALRHGDILKVGPFQFRLDLVADPTVVDEQPGDEIRDALRIQAAAVAAQQCALEEEEARLQQRRTDLQQQEEQLAAHLDEKQQQVQLWADFTTAERETLRQEKIEQENHLAKLEKELWQAKEEVTKEQHALAKAKVRIDKIYQRLRERWRRHWTAERIKYERLVENLAAERVTFHERERVLHDSETKFAQEVVHSNTERELGMRRLREGRDLLRVDQDGWRRRRSKEQLVLKARARELEATQVKVKQIRQLLVQEKETLDMRHDALHKELHGLNNRVIHQRRRMQEQQEEIVRLDAALAERRLQIAPEGATGNDGIADAAAVDVRAEAPARVDETARRFGDLDRLAGELADQRAHMVEQYTRMTAIHDGWQCQRDHAAAELESLAARLIDEEQALAQRERHTSSAEESLQERTREVETLRQQLLAWRSQLKIREQAFSQQHKQETQGMRQHQRLLEEQLAGLATLRQRWNLRRQAEIERLQAERLLLAQEQKQTQDRRLALFEKSQQVDKEKRILAEKALALEQYRQELFVRAKDPAAQRRVERLRRRWLTLNSMLIRNAKSAGEMTRKELADLETQRAELAQANGQLTKDEADLADRQALLEERETDLTFRRQQLEIELYKLQNNQAAADVEATAHAFFDESDAQAA